MFPVSALLAPMQRGAWFVSALCGIFLAATAVAGASCPAPPDGSLQPEATAAPLNDPPSWRPRVVQIEHDLAASDLTQVKLLFLGDSIIERWDAANFDRNFAHLGALRLGVSGDTTQGLLWRLPRMGLGTTLRPKLVVVLIGANNVYPSADPKGVAMGIGEAVRAVQKLIPSTKVLVLGLLPRGPVADDSWRLVGNEINTFLAACADNRTVFYADPGRVLASPGSGVSKDVEEDYLHPTPLGYSLLADALDKEIRHLVE